MKTMAFTFRKIGAIENLSRGVTSALPFSQFSLAVVLKIDHREASAEKGDKSGVYSNNLGKR